MKKIYAALLLLSSVFPLSAQKPNPAYRLPETADMPEWAKQLYRDDVAVNVFELDEEFEAWEKTYEANEKAERAEWTDRGETPTFEENGWEEYYERWRTAVQPFIQPDGTLRFDKSLLPDCRPQATAPDAANWTLIGPEKTYWAKNDNAAQPLAPWQANIFSFDIAPSDPNTLLYGTATGLVAKSTDKGLHWTTLGLQYFVGPDMGAAAIHPTNTNILYIGDNTGVHTSTDGGTTWSQPLNVSSYNCNDLKIKPDDGEVVLAAGSSLRRRTAGNIWSTILTATTYDLAFKPGDPSVVYALVKNANLNLCEFWKSTDGGQSFTIRSNGWISGLTDGGGRLSVTPADALRVYAVLLTGGGPRVMRSNDSGETWNLMASGSTAALAMDNGQGYYDLSVVASHANADHLIVATTTAYKSTDGGLNYSALGGYSGPFGIHPDIQEMAAKDGDTWIVTDGGINYSTDFFTSTANHEARINGMHGTDFWGFDQGWNEDVLVGGRYHNGNTARRENYPAGEFLRMGGGEAATGYINPGNNAMVYYSDIGGKILPATINQTFSTFSVTKWPNEDFYEMEYSEQKWDPRYFYTYYIGEANQCWKTTDNGATFTSLFTHSDATALVQHIEVSRTDPKVLYCTVQRSSSGELWKTTDGGANWTQCANPAGPSASQRKISTITLSGTDPLTVWWCFRNGPNGSKIYKSINGGDTWTNLTTTTLNGLAISDMVHQLGTDGGVYISSNNGKVYYRNNGMGDWTLYNTGLPIALYSFPSLQRMKIYYKGNKLRMSTNKGLWETPLFENSTTTLVQPMVDNSAPSCSRDTLQMDSYSVVNGSATYQWAFSPAPQWISDANVRNPRIVLGSTPGPYSATLTVTDANGMTSRTINNLIDNLAIGNLCDADTIPGKSVLLDGSGDYVLANSNLNLNSNTVTMSAWVKRNGSQVDFSGMLYARGGTTSAGLSITSANQLRYTWDDAAGSYNFNTGFTIPDNTWTHIALVITPTNAKVYMNGVAATRTAAHAAEAFDTPLKIGYDQGSRYFKGQIEEVTVWNRSLSQNEIRELMHLTLAPPDQTGLVSYYQFDEPSGQVMDKVASRHASLVGNAVRTLSTCPVGKGVSARQTVGAGGSYVFGTTGLTLDFPPTGTYPAGELCVSRINQAPDQTPNAQSTGRAYWIVNNFGNNATFSQLSSLLFGDYETIAAGAQASNFALFKRNSFADGNTWGASIDAGDAVTPGVHGAVQFGAGNGVTSFSQFVVTYAAPLPVEWADFNVQLKGENTALLTWTTNHEKNNQRFEIEWMPGRNGVFSTAGVLAGKGTASGPGQYAFSVKDLAPGEHYFRIRQVDADGAFEFSPVKSVTVGAALQVSILPNPVQNELIVDVFQEKEAVLQISLVNALGQVTELLPAREAEKGAAQWRFDVSALPAGTYYCLCRTDQGAASTVRVVKN